MSTRTSAVFLVLVVAWLIPTSCLAQAFLPPKGELYLTTTYQTLYSNRHLMSESVLAGIDFGSTSVDFGTIRSRVVTVDADLGLTDSLALSAGAAIIQAQFTPGEFSDVLAAHTAPIDDGAYHGGLQDVWIGFRQVVQRGEWLFTPAITLLVPARDYETFGHSVIGRGLNRLDAAINVGRLLYFSNVPRAFVQGAYAYGLMENVGDIALDRSAVTWELGYFLTDTLTLQSFGTYQNTLGGVDWTRDLQAHNDHLAESFSGHDQAAAEDFLQLGGTLSWAANDSLDFFFSYSDTLWGVNTHNARAFTVGSTWFFDLFGESEPELRLSQRRMTPRLARSQLRALASESRLARR